MQNWPPTGYASNSNTDPAQFDNDRAGGNSVVGFLSGASSSLSQVVQGFAAGRTYRISVGADARAQSMTKPTFTISADSQQVLAPTTLAPVDALDSFGTAPSSCLTSTGMPAFSDQNSKQILPKCAPLA